MDLGIMALFFHLKIYREEKKEKIKIQILPFFSKKELEYHL
jgi:hypothetical protein